MDNKDIQKIKILIDTYGRACAELAYIEVLEARKDYSMSYQYDFIVKEKYKSFEEIIKILEGSHG